MNQSKTEDGWSHHPNIVVAIAYHFNQKKWIDNHKEKNKYLAIILNQNDV